MSHSLKYESFGSLLKNVVDNRGKTCPTANNGIPLIATNCIVNNYLYPIYEKVRYVNEETYKTWFRDHPKPGDMIFVLKGTPGRVAWVLDPVDFCIAQDMVAIRADEKKIFPKYLFAVLRSDSIQQEIEGLQVGSLIPHFKKGDFDDLKIPMVEPQLQEFIGNQYFDISLKIDLLHRQNKTLEAMTETLFRQWFVEEAEEGWEEKPLSSIANFLNGLACQKYPPKNEIDKLPVLKIKELSSGISESSDWATTEVSPEYIVQAGDVIFAWSASLIVKVWDGEKCVLNQHLFKVTSKEFPKWFYLAWCKYHLAEFISISLSHATTMGHIKRGDLDAVMVLVPSDSELFAMSEKMTPLLDKQIVNARQIRTLEKLRDTLLPKLISGEVRVKSGQDGACI
jgi:type I restriction enzyme S subunit